MRFVLPAFALLLVAPAYLGACADDASSEGTSLTPTGGTSAGGSGASGTGGTAIGGASTGATPSGGAATGGTTTDGGAGTGGAMNVGGMGTTGAGCTELPVCEDFDAASVGTLPAAFGAQLGYSNMGDASLVAVDATESHSAPNSVKVAGTNSGLFGMTYANPGDTFHLRAWFKIAVQGSGNPVIIGFGSNSQSQTPDTNAEMRMRLFKAGAATNHTVTANAANGDGLAPANSSGAGACPDCVELPADWFCLQLYVDRPSETIQMKVNGTEAVNVQNNMGWHTSGTWPATIDAIRIGSLGLNGGGATVYVDDLAIGPSEIACQ